MTCHASPPRSTKHEATSPVRNERTPRDLPERVEARRHEDHEDARRDRREIHACSSRTGPTDGSFSPRVTHAAEYWLHQALRASPWSSCLRASTAQDQTAGPSSFRTELLETCLAYRPTEIGSTTTTDGSFELHLSPGAYRLVSWQRICDGNCGNLDPPSQQCARPVTLRSAEQLTAAIRVNFASGCVIVLRH